MCRFPQGLSLLFLVVLLAACDDTVFGMRGGGSSSSSSVDTAWGDEPWCQVQRIFHNQCTSCHGGSPPSLEGEDAHENLVNVESSAYPGAIYVVAGSPDESFLYLKITGQQGDQGDPMPYGTSGADTDSAAFVRAWIEDGAPTDCDGGVSDTAPAARYHPDGWEEASAHGPPAKYQEDDCLSCHGEDLTGGAVDVSCDLCHEKGWRENCVFCHGGTDNTTGAPPRDISGETATASLSFRAHSAHVTTRWHEAYDCTQCHTKPTDVLSTGHLFVADTTAGVSEVRFADGLSASADYDGNGSCSNLYCHGNGRGNNGEATHTMASVTCSSCHPDSSSSDDDWDEMSGEHEDHLEEGGTCSQCHGATVDDDQNILAPGKHVNGVVDIQTESGVTWNSADKSCEGDCHIGDEDEEHEDEEWD